MFAAISSGAKALCSQESDWNQIGYVRSSEGCTKFLVNSPSNIKHAMLMVNKDDDG
jgi:hypothetical protein